jgi:hypothetical protein
MQNGNQSTAEKKPGTWPQYLGNVSQMVSALVAIIAVIFISYQVRQLQLNSEALKESELRTAARQIYMSYSDASIRYPEFAKPDYAKIVVPLEQIRYGFFVAHMLYAYDEMLKVFDNPEWKASFEYDLKQHLPYLCQLHDPAFFDQYFGKMRALLNEAQAKCEMPARPVFGK